VGKPLGTGETTDNLPLTRGASLAELGAAAFAAAWTAGRSLSLDGAIAAAAAVVVADVPDGGAEGTRGGPRGDALTAREQDVLRLLVDGRSNAEIAHALFIGVRTARAHVASILAKLGVPTRTAAATHAVRRGLI
jgi:DNA-binding NarL/FixJ family response regulator